MAEQFTDKQDHLPTKPKGRRVIQTILLATLAIGTCNIDADDRITLVTGETLRGELVERSASQLIFRHSILGEITLEAKQVTSIRLAGDRQDAGGAQGNGEETEAELGDVDAGAVVDGLIESETESASGDETDATVPSEALMQRPWNATLELGLNGTSGNSETVDGRFAFTISQDTAALRTIVDAAYYYGESFGERSTNRLTAGGRNDWKAPDSPFFYFAQGRYDYDEFQAWDYRYSAGGGVGYDVFRLEDFSLTTRAGFGAVHEVGSLDDEIQPEGIMGVDLSWQIAENQTLTAATTWFPNARDAQDYRLVVSADWLVRLDHARGMDFKLGMSDEFESMTDPGTEKNDFKVYGAIVIQF